MPVSYYIDTRRADRRGLAPIRASICVLGARLITTSGCKCEPSKWDAGRQIVRHGGFCYAETNALLGEITDRFSVYEMECLKAGRQPSPSDLRDEFARCFGRRRGPGKSLKGKDTTGGAIAPRLKEFAQEQGAANTWTDATYTKFAALGHHLEDYRAGVTFADFDERGLTAFVAFLRDTCQMRNSTIVKQLGFLKWFLRWAVAKGYNTQRAFEAFAPKLRQSRGTVVFLDWDELMRVLHYEVPPNGAVVTLSTYEGATYTKTVHDAAALKKTRDIFCFCAFTSLRYSDAQHLRRSDIVDGKITITTVKTADRITIELNKYALEILGRYSPQKVGTKYALPRMSNQRMNVYLKDLCELCGLNKPVTKTYYRGAERVDETHPKFALMGTHAGRRTFICNALMMGIPAEVVMKWTGHSDYKSMRPYVDIADAARAAEMDKFNRR